MDSTEDSVLDAVRALDTCELADGYAKLQLETLYGAVPVAPVSLSTTEMVLAAAGDYFPWLPTSLAVFADPSTGEAAADGMCVAVAMVQMSSVGAAFLSESTGSGWDMFWRWPIASGIVVAAEDVPDTIDRDTAVSRQNAGLAIRVWSLTPQDLDSAVGGTFQVGPRSGYMDLVWPPAEPEGESSHDGEEADAVDLGVVSGPEPFAEWTVDTAGGRGTDAFVSAEEGVDLLGLNQPLPPPRQVRDRSWPRRRQACLRETSTEGQAHQRGSHAERPSRR
jgi:hypothetical protein